MVKKIFLSLGLTSLLVSGLMACHPQGCTPGFWKTGNHIVGFQSEVYAEIFELDDDAAALVNAMVGDVGKKAYDKLTGMDAEDDLLELGEALWLEGNKDDVDGDKFLQLVRTSAAAMLNIRHLNWYYWYDDDWMDEDKLRELVQGAFAGSVDAALLQKNLDIQNNMGNNDVCPE